MSWTTTTLGDVCQVVGGATPKTTVAEYWDGGIPWVTPKDLSDIDGEHEIAATPRTLSQAGLKSCAATVLPAGSVLLSSRAPIGHVAINAVPMATNQGFKSLVPDPEHIDAKFLFWWLRRNRPMLEAMGTGATFKEISKRTTASIPIDLPPLEEQRRIAAVLDAADELQAKRRQALAKLDDLVRSVFSAMFGDLAQYELERFGSLLTEPLRNGISPAKAGTVTGEVLTLSAITGSGFDSSALKESTFSKRHAVDKTVRAEDFLICRGNGNLALVGRGKRPDQTMPDVAFPDTMIAARCDPERIAPGYLDHLWDGALVRRQLEAAARTTNGTHKINQTMIESVLLPLPSIAAQRQFADARDSITAQRGRGLCEAERLEVLFAALQERAFRGEL